MSRLSFSILVVAVLTTFLILSFGLSRHAQMIPLIAAAVGLSLAALQWFLDWRQRQQGGEKTITPTGSVELKTVTWILSLPVLIWLFGFVAGTPVYFMTYLRYRAALSWRSAVVAASLTTLALFFVFDQLMHMSLYGGVLWEKVIS